MTVSAISLSGISQVQAPRHPGNAAMNAAAKLLGMEPSEIRAAFEQGQTLADLAESKGISQDDLLNSMVSAIQQENPGISVEQATQMATRMATTTPPPPPPPPGGAPQGPQASGSDLLNAVAEALGVTADDVGSALQGGQSLVEYAKSQGVDEDTLIQALAEAFQKDNPNLSDELAARIATEFATATPSTGPYIDISA